MTIGWDDPATAALYERFNARHDRYRSANAELVAHAALTGDLDVLDVAAGTGRTTDAALALLGAGAHVTAYEPAAAMRDAGRARVSDHRVRWTSSLPAGETFDRVLCGASIWQLGGLADVIPQLAGLVHAGGALCFTIPALYLGEADEPGGGADPSLHALYAHVAGGRRPQGPPAAPLASAGELDALLADAGLVPEAWSFRRRMTQAELRDWLAIPVLTDALVPELAPDARIALVDDAYARTDRDSWRWERWRGWTAWRRD
jgi:SAM-dependent methyltransferase